MKQLKLQQGDVILKQINKAPKGKKSSHLILAEGEATGHHHRISNGEAELLTAGEFMYLIVKSKTAELEHEEHGMITIPKGDYIVTRVREWDYDIEEERQVID